jgi:hypothetical protein
MVLELAMLSPITERSTLLARRPLSPLNIDVNRLAMFFSLRHERVVSSHPAFAR